LEELMVKPCWRAKASAPGPSVPGDRRGGGVVWAEEGLGPGGGGDLGRPREASSTVGKFFIFRRIGRKGSPLLESAGGKGGRTDGG